MTLQRIETRETSQTMPALMPLFAGVGHRVGLEVRDLNESQAAFLTFVRPFIVVRAM